MESIPILRQDNDLSAISFLMNQLSIFNMIARNTGAIDFLTTHQVPFFFLNSG